MIYTNLKIILELFPIQNDSTFQKGWQYEIDSGSEPPLLHDCMI